MIRTDRNTQQDRAQHRQLLSPTGDLYEPLRNALEKSTKYRQDTYYNYGDNNYLKHSRVAKASRSLSSSEAENIKASIIFPNNKTLVPTKNLDKIMGKTFIAVDMQEKIKHAITYNQFLRVKTDGMEEIVYQIQEEDQMNKIFTYTTHATKNSLTNTNSPTKLNKYNESKIEKVRSKPRNYYQQSQKLRQAYETRQDAAPNVRHQFSSLYMQYPPQQLQKIQSKQLNFPPYSSFNPDPFVKPTLVESLPKKFSYSLNESENQLIIQPASQKPYKFKKQKMMTDSGQCNKSQVIQHKLNLFNMFDECGSSGCKVQPCRSNQLCASKITKEPWK